MTLTGSDYEKAGPISSESDDGRRPRILAVAFACDPEMGSEAAGGWGTVNALSEFADVVVLHHPRHTQNISAWQRTHPNPRLHFVPVETVSWGLGLQRIDRLARLSWLARYVGWLRLAREEGLRLHAEQPFDAAIHASLGMFWLPSTVVDLPMPSIWGPVSGGARSPRQLRRYLGWGGRIFEKVEGVIAAALAGLPWVRKTMRRADMVLVESASALDRLPSRIRKDARVVNRAILSHIREVPEVRRSPYVVFSSPLQRRKGPLLALEALAQTKSDVRLLFIHKGPEEASLRSRAEELGITNRVEFRGRVPRDEMWRLIAGASASVFAGLREEGGCALAEAMLAGSPVIVLGHGGARLLAESHLDSDRVAIVEPSSPGLTTAAFARAMDDFVATVPQARSSYLAQDSTKQALERAVRQVIGATPRR